MKFAGMKKFLAPLHRDKLFIKRPEKTKDKDGSKRTIIPETYTYSNIPCRVSFTSFTDNSDSQTSNVNPVLEQIKIFCDPSVDVKKGDYLYIERYDENNNLIETYKGTTGNKPRTYNLNKEILFTNKEDA